MCYRMRPLLWTSTTRATRASRWHCMTTAATGVSARRVGTLVGVGARPGARAGSFCPVPLVDDGGVGVVARVSEGTAMTVADVIAELQAFEPSQRVVGLGPNGQGKDYAT